MFLGLCVFVHANLFPELEYARSGAGECAGRSCGGCPVGGYPGLIVVGLEGSGGHCRRGCGEWVPMDGGAGCSFAGFSGVAVERWIVSR